MADQASTAEPEKGSSAAAATRAEHVQETQSTGGGGTATAAPPFEPDEFAQLENEDTKAGRNIGLMLVTFFFYTVAVMALVGLLTFKGCLG